MKKILLYTALMLGALIALFPMIWMISASLMPAGEASTYPPRLWRSHITFEHYEALFTRLNLGRYLVNSALIVFTVTIISLAINSMAGYAFAKLSYCQASSRFSQRSPSGPFSRPGTTSCGRSSC